MYLKKNYQSNPDLNKKETRSYFNNLLFINSLFFRAILFIYSQKNNVHRIYIMYDRKHTNPCNHQNYYLHVINKITSFHTRSA
jgi:hypothetical protein